MGRPRINWGIIENWMGMSYAGCNWVKIDRCGDDWWRVPSNTTSLLNDDD